ncbi:MAG: class I SAM-dependent methyltransferase [Candidatus Binatia bacterium]
MAVELKYEYGVEDQLHKPYSVVAKVYKLVPDGRSVLDVGCYTGRFGALLKRKGCRVTGIEVNPMAAERAKLVLDEVRLVDVENSDSFYDLKSKYDVILFLDILEHCRCPREVLKTARDLLTREGFVVASIPNIANWWVRKNLLFGKFEYESIGIMDETHLRFYTIDTVRKLFHEAGYKIELMEHRYSFPFFRVRKCFGGILAKVLGPRLPGMFSYQMVIKARPEAN